MIESWGLFALGLLLLALGGDSVVKGASGLARERSASTLVAGLLIVAFAASLPELAVNAHALANGDTALALGNTVGSNIANIGLTLAVAALAAPLVVAWRALNPLLLALLGGTVLAAVLSLDGTLSNIDGVVLVAAYAAGVIVALVAGRRAGAVAPADVAAYVDTRPGLGLNLVRLAIAAALLWFGGRLVATHGIAVGASMGLAPLLAGLLPVAIATALPEAAAAVVAARRGQADMVVGFVIGSSLFNLLMLGAIAAAHGLAIPASFVRLEWPAAFVLALMLVPMLRGDLRVSRTEGAVLGLAFLAWVGFEVATLA